MIDSSDIEEALDMLSELDDAEKRFELRVTGPGGAAAFEESLSRDLELIFQAIDAAKGALAGADKALDELEAERDSSDEARYSAEERLEEAQRDLKAKERAYETLEAELEEMRRERDDALEEARLESRRADESDRALQALREATAA